jgi:hypothetical protein
LPAGHSLHKQLQDAIAMQAKHDAIFSKLTAKFTTATIEKWVAMVDLWDMDKNNPDPYQEPQKGTTIYCYSDSL